MALNRRQRRARKDRRPHAGDTPQQQMRDFLKAPGKLHIVQLADDKSFVVKVTDREMPLFLTICGQLRAVLGHCEAIPATPVDASVVDAVTHAQQTAGEPTRLADAQRRQDAAEAARAKAAKESASAADQAAADELAASIARHPAGKKRTGRHAKPEADTVLDMLAAGADTDDDTTARIAAIELAAAQDDAARAQEAADAANARLAEVYERTGEIHNKRVIDRFTDAAGQAIADKVENDGLTPMNPQWEVHGPGRWTIDDSPDPDAAIVEHRMRCPRPDCRFAAVGDEITAVSAEFARHMYDHVCAETKAKLADCMCPTSMADDTRTGTHPRCPQHGPDYGKPTRVIADNPQG